MKILLLFAGTLAFATPAFSQAGSLDLSFGSGGKVITSLVTNQDKGKATTIQPDGKILVAGSTYVTTYDFAVTRYNTNGSLDTSFGNGGIVITDFFYYDEEARCIALQPDGKIIVAGWSYKASVAAPVFAAARYLPDGSLDFTFGIYGRVQAFYNSAAFANACFVQPDGKILLAGVNDVYGNFGTPDFALMRLNTNGSLDTSFGNAGVTITDFNTSEDEIFSFAFQPDGKIVAAGRMRPSSSTNFNFALARYDSSGILDATFGIGGKMVTDFYAGSNNDAARAVVVQPDGKIVAVGSAGTPFNFLFAAARYDSTGTLDPSFGTGGKLMAGQGFANALLLQPDSSFILGGRAGTDFAFYKIRPNGTIDSLFANTGLVMTDFGSNDDEGAALARQTDGKLILAGTTNGSFALARYNMDNLTGIPEPNVSSFSSIYPNPTNGPFTISTNTPNAQWRLYNSCGQLLRNETIENESALVTLENLPAGFYVIEITANNAIERHPLLIR